MDEWLHAYDMCSKYLDRLDPDDIVTFIDEITFSSKAVTKVSTYIWRISGLRWGTADYSVSEKVSANF